MFLMPRNPFLKDLLIFDFPFLRKGQFCSKFKRGHFSMISGILKLICCLNVTSPKENHMIDEHEKFQLFSIHTLPTKFISRAHFACHRVCTGVNEL